MSRNKALAGSVIAAALLWAPLEAQQASKGRLAAASAIRCTFPLTASSAWRGGQHEANVKPAKLTLEFESINADEGTAQLKSGFGQFDIVVRYADGYLHFIQSFLNGPLYTTTVVERKTGDGKLRAVHSRHEYTDFALPGYTSSPEQYYGECEVVK